jgi:hypothetical protein
VHRGNLIFFVADMRFELLFIEDLSAVGTAKKPYVV